MIPDLCNDVGQVKQMGGHRANGPAPAQEGSTPMLSKPNVRRPNGYWDAVILPRAAEIVSGYDTPVTLRQLFYRLVSEELVRNTTADYTQLSSRSAAVRRHGLFPDLLDRNREIVVPVFWSSPEHALDALRRQYRNDRTEGQEWTIYLGIEKAGLVEQLSRWFGVPFGIPILPLGGYSSETFERQIITHAEGQDRPSVLLYAGDLDPSGEDIERNLLEHTDFDEFKKIALTIEQAVEYDLPALVGKETDTRAAGFVEKYGRLFQIEVDALDPNVLRDLFAREIAGYWDTPIYNNAIEREAQEREQIA